MSDFNTLSHQLACYPPQKIYKEISKLNDIIDQTDLTDIYRIFQTLKNMHVSQQPMKVSLK